MTFGVGGKLFMTESQNIEYKESWRDEYLKWVCGFANAHIGINDAVMWSASRM